MSTAPYVIGAVAALSAIKALWRPHRAIVREGAVGACPGSNSYGTCDPTLALDVQPDTAVYSTATGKVVAIGDQATPFIHIATRNEPTVLYYDGVMPSVREGQYVGRGQRIGSTVGAKLYFGVQQFEPGGGVVNVDPASWLAVRGQRIAARDTGNGALWCESGRHVTVPASAGRPCQLYEPERAGFALLPVTVEVER